MYSKLDKILHKHKQREQVKELNYKEWYNVFNFFIKKEEEDFVKRRKPRFNVGDVVTLDFYEMANKSRNGWDTGSTFFSYIYDGKYKFEPLIAQVKKVTMSSEVTRDVWEKYTDRYYDRKPFEVWQKLKRQHRDNVFGDIGIYWNVKVKPFNPHIKEFSLNEFSFIYADSEEAKKTFELFELEKKLIDSYRKQKILQTEINEKKQKL